MPSVLLPLPLSPYNGQGIAAAQREVDSVERHDTRTEGPRPRIADGEAGDGEDILALGVRGGGGQRFEPGAAIEQHARIVLGRAGEQGRGRPLLDHVAAPEHHDLRRIFRDDTQIVGDEQHGHATRQLQIMQQFENLGLDAHVERSGGFVGDQQVRIAGQGRGDDHALLLAARQLVRIAALDMRNGAKAHFVQEPGNPQIGFGARQAMGQSLAEMIAHTHQRIERRGRVLENDADALAAQGTQAAFIERQQVDAVEQGRALQLQTGAGRGQPHQRHGRQRLARPRFTHKAQSLAFGDGEGDAANGFDGSAAGIEGDAQIGDAEQRCHQIVLKRGLMSLRMVSATKLAKITVTPSQMMMACTTA
ncbi:MAG: hypothetical protein NVV79_08490 [Devosia ginsengisoli]|nr:hypothetical protein [Devosia ginsengisoli]MCR6671374.1 hypothetical protein [Devosia ginsengisoli]